MLKLRIRSLFRRRKLEQELDEEIRYHLQRETHHRIAKGSKEDEALREALLAFRGVEQRKEECRDVWGVRLLGNLMQDLRHGFRSLGRNPGFTAVAVLTLALGIGANTTIFTLLDPILFRALPYSNPEQLVRIHRTSPQSNRWPHSVPNFLDYRTQNTAFTRMAAFTWSSFSLSEPAEPADRVYGLTVSSDFFPLLGVSPLLGRVFTDDEDKPAAQPVIVISHRFWTVRFGNDPAVIGRTLRFNGRDAKVIGVMPDNFENTLFFGQLDLWVPLAFTDAQRQNRGNNYLSIVGRLGPGVSVAQAESQLGSLADRLRKEHGESDQRNGIRLEPLKTSITPGTLAQVSWFTFGMTVLVLLIACVNLANLQLARTTTRAREFAVRAALGGSKWRLIRHSLTESVVISVLGGVLALPPSIASAKLVIRRAFSDVPGAALPFDYRFFAFAFFCSLLAGVIFGIVPAWLGARSELSEFVKDNPRNVSTSRRQRRLRHALIVAEVAFALVLLASTGAFIRGLSQLIKIDPGWSPDGVLIGGIGLDGPNYAAPREQVQFLNRLREQLATLPGVESAAISLSAPTWGFETNSNMTIDNPEGPTVIANNETISPQYFETLKIPLKEGRTFTEADRFGKPSVVIVNETMARTFWANQSAVGKRIVFAGDSQMRWMEIVGVVSDVRFPSTLISVDTNLTFYRPIAQSATRAARVLIRASGPPEALIPAVRRVAGELDKDQPIFYLRSARRMIEENVAQLDLAGNLLAAFSALGLILAAVGIFGVISYSVTQRTSEIGIRIALGAEGPQVRWLVLRQGLSLTILGAVIGLTGAAAAARILSNAIPGLPTNNALALIAMTVLLLIVASLACYLPARRASLVDPMIALRHE